MLCRLAAGVILLAAFTHPAVADEQTDLPDAMLGTWAPDASACVDKQGEINDARIAVSPDSVEYFASIWSGIAWQQQSDGYSGSAQVSEEGEGEPDPDRQQITLRLLPDGRLEISRGADPGVYVKCAQDVPVR